MSDVFQTQFNFTRGAVGYVTNFTGPWLHFGSGNSVGWGQVADGIFDIGTRIELTEGWGFAAAYEHHWNPNWKTSLYGGFTQIRYNDTATALICTFGLDGTTAVSNCNPDFSWFQVGSRTEWNPVKDLDVGVDVLYTRLDTAFAGTAVLPRIGARPAGTYVVEDQQDWTFMFRVQRNFLP